jgi:hypothetical protein
MPSAGPAPGSATTSPGMTSTGSTGSGSVMASGSDRKKITPGGSHHRG